MAIHRIRCSMRFTKTSGMAPWVYAQMDVRYGQAVHINEGLAEEEQKRNEVIEDGDHEFAICDLPLMNEAHAVDAFNTLSDASVMAHIEDDDQGGPSWIEHHICRHDETPNKPCEIISKVIKESSSGDEIEAWVQPAGEHDAYMAGDKVLHNGQTWESTIDNNTWEPGVYGWTVI